MPAKSPDPVSASLGAAVARFREARGWRQADLAEALSAKVGRPIDPTLITRLELGRRNTPAGDIAALADIFGVPVSAFFSSDDPFFGEGFTRWEMRENLRAYRDALERAAREYGEARHAFEHQLDGEPVEDAADIAERGEREGWNRREDFGG
jgi:transcriptional regulator with XRE-family HTH domain